MHRGLQGDGEVTLAERLSSDPPHCGTILLPAGPEAGTPRLFAKIGQRSKPMLHRG